MADVHELLDTWIDHVQDEELLDELKTMKASGDEDAITDAFFQDLAFGTAGLRGTIGAGTNRMNIYTVGRATQGFADYLNATFENPTVAIARDSRNKGELFVKTTAAILAANGVTALVYPKISPVPTLSWAVRDLKCSGGICMTASHNPAPYNGYKAYGPDGCQITSEAAAAISKAIEETDTFNGVKSMDFNEALAQGKIKWIGDDCLERYYDAVLERGVTNLSADQIAQAPLKLVYTPLNGTGLIPVTTVLERAGITDVTVVPEQKNPDGNFPTCPYPNPEIREAMQKFIRTCCLRPIPMPTVSVSPSRMVTTICCSPATRWAFCCSTISARSVRSAVRTCPTRLPSPRSCPLRWSMPLPMSMVLNFVAV